MTNACNLLCGWGAKNGTSKWRKEQDHEEEKGWEEGRVNFESKEE